MLAKQFKGLGERLNKATENLSDKHVPTITIILLCSILFGGFSILGMIRNAIHGLGFDYLFLVMLIACVIHGILVFSDYFRKVLIKIWIFSMVAIGVIGAINFVANKTVVNAPLFEIFLLGILILMVLSLPERLKRD